MDLCSGGDVLWIVLEVVEVEIIFFFYKGICCFLLNPLKYSRLGSFSPEILCLDAK